ncbi:twin-arginine translocation signal domain-containing protein [Shewanella sp. NIFS-20-20]|uniref:twin-arginine translocation signal domain-containing protein n=1 Tax=Shewanella sp. NIFS-20-20 TaxID=2853806 RepID=UPI001C4488FD|nr:twin-arginine translocation signal domain-containing protein [Shewanella sp. NIFS-20-20]MBV7316063.1 twin-arginine translocation signal domain-containing protein [Shewanella sp. NIFS-20-20]
MKKQAAAMSRREALKALAIGTVAGTAVTLTSTAVAESSDVTPAVSKGEGYRETPHIRAYYASLR